MTKQIPDIVVGRLPRYLQALEHMQKDGFMTTSSKELGANLGISAAQIRKDLSQFGGFGKQGMGYSIQSLINQLRSILHVNQSWKLALVGIGDLGNALARYQGFTSRGFHIVLAFDIDPEKIGGKIGNIEIMDAAKIAEEVRKNDVKIAMLTVPSTAAQNIAVELVKGGVLAILNYAPISLSLPDHVHVEYVDPIVKLQHMTFNL